MTIKRFYYRSLNSCGTLFRILRLSRELDDIFADKRTEFCFLACLDTLEILCMLEEHADAQHSRNDTCQKALIFKSDQNREENCRRERHGKAVVEKESKSQREQEQDKENDGADAQHPTAERGKTFSALESEVKGIIVTYDRAAACDKPRQDVLAEYPLTNLYCKERLENIEKHNENAPASAKMHKGVAGTEIFRSALADIYIFNPAQNVRRADAADKIAEPCATNVIHYI